MSAYDHAWRRARAKVLAGAQACWICGGALDWHAPPRSPKSPSVDHIFPVKHMRSLDARERRRLMLESENLRPVHHGCNSKRGAGRSRRTHTSRTWQ